MNSFGCRTRFREDTTFATGRLHAINDAVLCFRTGTILGFAVGSLRPRLMPKRFSLPQTALRLCPRRLAICAALCPEAQSFLSNAKSSAPQFMKDTYTSNAACRLVVQKSCWLLDQVVVRTIVAVEGEVSRPADLVRFYALLGRLSQRVGGTRALARLG